MADAIEMPMLPAELSMGLAHNGLRFSLEAAPALIVRAQGDPHRTALVTDFLSSTLLGLEVHHEGENELLFPLLTKHFPDERATVELGAEQHREVVPALHTAEAALNAWASEEGGAGTRLTTALKSLDEVLSIHLDYEEAAIVPIEARLPVDDRRRYLDETRDHHVERIPNLIAFLFSRFHGGPLLLDAVGESSFRDMIESSQRP